jgi:very-short-patch-repair endonuclease
MWGAFVGAEAVKTGRLTRGQLRSKHTAVHPGVYMANDAERTLSLNTVAAWLWTSRRGVIAGRAAAALHGAKWIDASTPIELIAEHTRKRDGVIVREERIGADEVTYIGELPVTTIARTALDLARHLPRDIAVMHLDALTAATGVLPIDALALAEKYPGLRGIRRARTALALMDSGSESPKETWLRLVLIDGGFGRPRTQIRLSDGVKEAFIDMGYDEPKVGFDYDGWHHSENRYQYVHDIGRAEFVEREGWLDIRVVAEHSRRFILHRAREAFARRGWVPPTSA